MFSNIDIVGGWIGYQIDFNPRLSQVLFKIDTDISESGGLVYNLVGKVELDISIPFQNNVINNTFWTSSLVKDKEKLPICFDYRVCSSEVLTNNICSPNKLYALDLESF